MAEYREYRGSICESVAANSADYFSRALVKSTGFREYDVRWLIGQELNEAGMILIGQAFGTLLQEDYRLTQVVVGHDYRQYSQAVQNALVLGLLSTGLEVIDIGLTLSPALYFAQYHLQCKGGAMVTASHNENGWTGIKLGYDYSRTLGPEGILRLRQILHGRKFIWGRGAYRRDDSLGEAYLADLAGRGRKGRQLRIVVATGNGTAGLFTPEALRRCGHEVIERYSQLDWNFPHFNPNPEDVAFLEDIGRAVTESRADLGIGIDGDGDRLGVVDERGHEIFSDKVGLLLARDMARENRGSTFVVDVKSTGLFRIDAVLAENGCRTVYWKTGHSYIKSKVHELSALAGFEKSGHIFLGGRYGRAYDDGTLAAITFCNMLAKAEKPLSQLLAELPRSFQTPTMAPYCADAEKYAVVEQIRAGFEADLAAGRGVAGVRIKELITVNGVRAHFEDGSWGLLRASSNKPSLVVVAESFGRRKRLYEIVADIERRLAETGKVGAWDQTLPPYAGE